MRRLSLLLAVLALSACRPEQKAGADLLAGAAAAIINPEPGSYIAGDRRDRRFEGVHDSLYVKAVAISDQNSALVLFTVDCIGLLYPSLQKIRRVLSSDYPEAGLDPNCIVMSSTHTHSGPDVVGLWGPDQGSSGLDPVYMERLIATAAKTIASAWTNRVPARMRLGETTHGEGWVYNISKPGEMDRILSVARFEDRAGLPIATLINFACHPTFLDGVNDRVSSDYVGGLYREMNARAGGVNLFLQGAIGGWVQPEYEEKTFDNALRRGRDLAKSALSALDDAPYEETTALSFRTRRFRLPVDNPLFRQISAIGLVDRPVSDSLETECAWFGIGRAVFATHPGETSPAYSLATRDLMPANSQGFIIGLGMDALGYILTPDFFDPAADVPHAGYLTGMSVGSQTGPIMMQVLESMAKEALLE